MKIHTLLATFESLALQTAPAFFFATRGGVETADPSECKQPFSTGKLHMKIRNTSFPTQLQM